MEDEATPEVDALSIFPDEWRQPIEGLMYLGKLSETVEFCGHSFGLKTLLPHEKFAIGVAVHPYRNTLMEVDAFQTAHIALALTSMDGDESFCPAIGPDINAFARARLNWISKHLYPPTVDFLWSRYQLLETTATEAVKEIDRLSTGSQPTTLPPWLDSLIAQGILPDETISDIPQPTPSN